MAERHNNQQGSLRGDGLVGKGDLLRVNLLPQQAQLIRRVEQDGLQLVRSVDVLMLILIPSESLKPL